jgi:hypothetical protein
MWAGLPLENRMNEGHRESVLRIRVRRIRIFLGHLDPDSLVRGTNPAPSRILLPSSKNGGKPQLLLFCSFFMTFFSLKYDENEPSRSYKQKI